MIYPPEKILPPKNWCQVFSGNQKETSSEIKLKWTVVHFTGTCWGKTFLRFTILHHKRPRKKTSFKKTRNNSQKKTALSSICIGSKSTKYSTMRPNNTKAPSFVLKFLTPSHQGEVVGIMRENQVWCQIYATKFLTYQNYMVWKNGISGFNYGAMLGQISAGVDHPFRMRVAFWMRANGLHVKV